MNRCREAVVVCAAFALSGCALAPGSKTFYLTREDWRGVDLSARGRLVVADAVAGAAPNMITILAVGALETAPRDLKRRVQTQDERAQNLAATLERHGTPPADIAIEALAGGAIDPILPQAKPMVIVVNY
jgi:hypothetical protein